MFLVHLYIHTSITFYTHTRTPEFHRGGHVHDLGIYIFIYDILLEDFALPITRINVINVYTHAIYMLSTQDSSIHSN